MPDERLLSIWRRAKAHLEQARVSLADPEDQALAMYYEFRDHNELGLALEELAHVAGSQRAPHAVWAELSAAAAVMGPATDDLTYNVALRQIGQHLAAPGGKLSRD